MIINYEEKINNRSKDIESLYRKYPVLEKVDKKNNGIINLIVN